jgi:hypothetical protein
MQVPERYFPSWIRAVSVAAIAAAGVTFAAVVTAFAAAVAAFAVAFTVLELHLLLL